jgi:hypothetical protein
MKRELKVYRKMKDWKDNIPQILLQGKRLKKAGFNLEDHLIVSIDTPKKIIIELANKPETKQVIKRKSEIKSKLEQKQETKSKRFGIFRPNKNDFYPESNAVMISYVEINFDDNNLICIPLYTEVKVFFGKFKHIYHYV